MPRAMTPEEKKQAALEKIAQQDAPKKRERLKFGVPTSKLTVVYDIPGFHIHWVNDSAGRIHQAELGGYQFVTPEEVGLEPGEEKVKRLVGKNDDGSGLYAYLMKINLEWYEEDQKEIQGQIDQVDQAIRRGSYEDTPGSGRYVPKEGIKIKS